MLRAATRAVGLAIVVEIMLAVVLLAIDALTFDVGGMLETRSFLGRHLAVGLGLVFHRLEMLLAFFEASRFPGGQRSGTDTLFDAFFLIELALIKARGGLGEGRECKNGNGSG